MFNLSKIQYLLWFCFFSIRVEEVGLQKISKVLYPVACTT